MTETATTRGEIRALTGVRGIAALYVAIYHIKPAAGTELLAEFGRHGYLAVDLFFVLSGFVMAMTYGDLFRNGFSVAPYLAFLKKRIARVYPLYLAATLVMSALVVARHTQHLYGDFWHAFAANVLMVQAWGVAQSIASASWSISTEWAAYLLFPALAATMLRGRPVVTALGTLACAVAIAAVSMGDSHLVLGSQPLRNGPLDLTFYDSVGPMVRCIAGFSLGLLAYRVRSAAAVLAEPVTAAVVGVAVLVLLFVPRADVFVVLLFPALILSLSFEAGPFARVLRSTPVYLLGVWSYSLYLIHPKFFVLEAMIEPHVGAVLATIATLGVVIALSWAAYRLIELPGRRALNAFFARTALTRRQESPHHRQSSM
jgi:peptidoglycan/LPS O-acetylase OafA/YrhL